MGDISQDKQGVNTRIAAAQVLAQVFDTQRTLDDALDNVARKYRINDADIRLVHAICGFVFRNLNTIDSILLRIMNRKRPASPMLLHQLLRVGVAQLLYMDVAEHAAVHATVSAVGSLHLARQKGLVNAVLRTVQRQKPELLAAPVNTLTMLPQWLSSRWVTTFGESEALSYITAMHQEAPIDITIKDAKASLEWAQKLGGEYIGLGSVRMRHAAGHVVSWAGFEEGAWWVQDFASSIPTNMLGDVAGKSVLDICAAPGGKTMQLAAAGAKVTALDVSASRMQRVSENLARTNLAQQVQMIVADAAKWQTEARFDVILCDAPCSSTGTLRRHPELPWNHSEKQLEKTCASQRAILHHASKMLAAQGLLLYVTCSMEVEEGENQVESFLSQHSNFKEIVDVPPAVQPFLKRGLNNVGWRAYPTLLADKGGMDGFFMALLQKQE